MIDPRLVAETIRLMEQYPDATIEDDPPGMIDAVLAEQELRASAKSKQDVMDSGPYKSQFTPDEIALQNQEAKQRKTGRSEAQVMQSSRDMLQKQRDSIYVPDKNSGPIESAVQTAFPIHKMVDPSTGPGAAVQGGLQTLTGGFADELAGVGNAIGQSVMNPELSGQGTIDAYTKGRNAVRDDFATAAKEQPWATGGGMVGAGVMAPTPKLGAGGAMIQGGKVGGIMGAGMSNDLGTLPEDTAEGVIGGTLLGRASEMVGSGLQSGARWLGTKADDLLAAALKIPVGSDEYIKMKDMGMLDDILGKVRDNAEFPYGAGQTRLNIEEPAIAKAQSGTVVNPDLEVPALSGPPSLDAAYTASYMRPQTRPAPNQMPYADRMASQQLGKVIKGSGSGIQPGSGLQAQTATGGIVSAAMSRGEMIGGVGFARIAAKMRDLAGAADQSRMMSQAGTGKLLQLIDAIEKSPHPEVDDYIAQETEPNYKALRIEADNATREEDAKR